MGDHGVSIVPVLDQWIKEGRTVDKEQLRVFIKEMRRYRRFKHALEISMWMSEKRYFILSIRDIAIRLDLISKVHGIEQAENYFNSVPVKLKTLEVYGALLNCYAHEKSVEKAEAIMQKLRDLGLAKTSLSYNVLLNLYYQTGNHEKVDSLMYEMEEKGIECDRYTFGIRLSAYAAAHDIDGMDKILTRMETDVRVVMDWTSYAVAANGYLKAGLVDKAFIMLEKSEGLVKSVKKRRTAYEFLLTQYAATGRKDEVLRIWEVYKKNGKVYNKGYLSVIPSLLKLNDIESAEQIFAEWESQELDYDLRIPNYLIGAYCRNGFVGKAEDLVKKIMLKGEKPDAYTWYYMATGYFQDDQPLKAVEAMREAISVCRPRWKPNQETLCACLEYLEGKGDLKGVEEFLRLLRDKNIVSSDVYDRLLNYVNNVESNSIPSGWEAGVLLGDGDTNQNLEPATTNI